MFISLIIIIIISFNYAWHYSCETNCYTRLDFSLTLRMWLTCTDQSKLSLKNGMWLTKARKINEIHVRLVKNTATGKVKKEQYWESQKLVKNSHFAGKSFHSIWKHKQFIDRFEKKDVNGPNSKEACNFIK